MYGFFLFSVGGYTRTRISMAKKEKRYIAYAYVVENGQKSRKHRLKLGTFPSVKKGLKTLRSQGIEIMGDVFKHQLGVWVIDSNFWYYGTLYLNTEIRFYVKE